MRMVSLTRVDGEGVGTGDEDSSYLGVDGRSVGPVRVTTPGGS